MAKNLKLALFLVAFVAGLAALELGKGGFYIGKHEGDTLHLLQMVLRMAAGDVPHRDFHTPIGFMALWPIVVFLKAGLGVGRAMLAAQLLVAAVLLPAIWWVAASRFRGVWAFLFGAAVLVLSLALVHGETDTSVSISMHYNRWAWAVSWLVIATALVPARKDVRANPVADGVVIGTGMALLALIKVTYFVGFAPAVLVAVLASRQPRILLTALISGLGVAVLATLVMGVAFWGNYLSDLLVVRASTVRPQPSLPFGAVVAAPAYMAGSLVAVLGVVLLRQSGRAQAGLVLLLLVPGFFYVTYQNYANDPQWLGLLGAALWALAPRRGRSNGLGWNLHQATRLTAMAALILAAPSMLNLAYSPFRHAVADPAEYAPMLPGSGINQDLQIKRSRTRQVLAQMPIDGPGTPFAAYTDADMHADSAVTFQGENLPICTLQVGAVPWYTAMADDLIASGLARGKTVLTADLLSAFWLYGAFEPLPGASPWYYGGLPGWEAADYLLVPLCPMAAPVRKMILEEVTRRATPLTEVRRNQMYILYQK